MQNEELKASFDRMTIAEVVREFHGQGEIVDSLSAKLKREKELYDFIAKDYLPERMDSEHVSVIKVDGIGRLQKRGEVAVNVTKSRREELHDFLRENGYGDLISETVAPQTLKSWVKEQMTNGIEVPDSINVHSYQVASIVKS